MIIKKGRVNDPSFFNAQLSNPIVTDADYYSFNVFLALRHKPPSPHLDTPHKPCGA